MQVQNTDLCVYCPGDVYGFYKVLVYLKYGNKFRLKSHSFRQFLIILYIFSPQLVF